MIIDDIECAHDIAEGEWCCPCGLWYDPSMPTPTPDTPERGTEP